MNFLFKLLSLLSAGTCLPFVLMDILVLIGKKLTLNIHNTRSNQWIKKLRLFYLRLKKQQQSNNQTKPTQNNNT